jgi:hypothetical protein
MEYIGKQNLEIMEEMAPFYNRFLANQFKTIFKKSGAKSHDHILDFGAGIGSIAVELKKLGFDNVDCLEVDSAMQQIMSTRNLPVYSNMNDLPHMYPYVYLSNVLEHIEDDEALLRTICDEVMEESGILIIYVPAFHLLFSELDRQVGHFRRYRISPLSSVVESAGLVVLERKYVDSLGFFFLLILKFLLKRNLSLTSNKTLLQIYDLIAFPISRFLDRLGLSKCFGKNILLVASRETSL